MSEFQCKMRTANQVAIDIIHREDRQYRAVFKKDGMFRSLPAGKALSEKLLNEVDMGYEFIGVYNKTFGDVGQLTISIDG